MAHSRVSLAENHPILVTWPISTESTGAFVIAYRADSLFNPAKALPNDILERSDSLLIYDVIL